MDLLHAARRSGVDDSAPLKLRDPRGGVSVGFARDVIGQKGDHETNHPPRIKQAGAARRLHKLKQCSYLR